MTCAFAPLPAPILSGTSRLVIEAARCWREARDHRYAVLPILFAHLERRRAGMLAPAIDALLAMLEAWSGRRFGAGDPVTPALTWDEHQLLALLDNAPPPSAAKAARPGLTKTLHIALRSTRIVLRDVHDRETFGPPAPAPDDAPIFFGPNQPLESRPEPRPTPVRT